MAILKKPRPGIKNSFVLWDSSEAVGRPPRLYCWNNEVFMHRPLIKNISVLRQSVVSATTLRVAICILASVTPESVTIMVNSPWSYWLGPSHSGLSTNDPCTYAISFDPWHGGKNKLELVRPLTTYVPVASFRWPIDNADMIGQTVRCHSD